MVTVRTGAAVAAVMVLGLTACSGEDKPVPPAPAQTVATVSSRPTPTVIPTPTMPAAAKANTPAGAEAFVRYVLDLYAYTYLSGDTEPWRKIGSRECGFCSKTLEEVIAIRNDRQRSTGGELTAREVLAAPNPPPGSAVVTVLVDEAASRIIDEDGKVVHSYAPIPGQSLSMILEWRKNSWSLFGVGDNKR